MSSEQKTLDVFWNIGDNRHYRIDLVFYPRILKCHVLLDLKIGEFDHADAGQMNMYLNYYKENKSHNGDNPPIGIILCNGKNEALVKYTTTGLPQKFFVSKYLVNLPSEKELLRIVAEEREKYYFLKCRFNFSWHHHGRKSYIGWIKWYLLVIAMKLFLLMGPYQLCQQVVIMHCP